MGLEREICGTELVSGIRLELDDCGAADGGDRDRPKHTMSGSLANDWSSAETLPIPHTRIKQTSPPQEADEDKELIKDISLTSEQLSDRRADTTPPHIQSRQCQQGHAESGKPSQEGKVKIEC